MDALGPLGRKQSLVPVVNHRGARSRRNDDRVVTVEDLHEMPGQARRCFRFARAHRGLTAAGLSLGELDRAARGLEQSNRRDPGLGRDRVDDARHKQRNLVVSLAPCGPGYPTRGRSLAVRARCARIRSLRSPRRFEFCHRSSWRLTATLAPECEAKAYETANGAQRSPPDGGARRAQLAHVDREFLDHESGALRT